MAKRRVDPYRSGDVTLGWRDGAPVADFKDAKGKRQRVRLFPYNYAPTEAEIHAAINRQSEANRAVRKTQADKTIGHLWELWLKDREGDELPSAIYWANWKSLEPAFGSRSPALLTMKDWRDYARDRFAIGRKRWTVHTELSRLKHCLQWSVKSDLIAKMPPYWIPKRGDHRERVLSFDEVRRLLAGAGDPHIRLFIVLLVTTGARHGAVLDLEWSRVDFIAGLITFDDKPVQDPMSKSWRKGRATVPMSSFARRELEAAFAGRQTDHVIEHGGRRLKTVKSGFAAATARAGLGEWYHSPTAKDWHRVAWWTDITPHTIRHSVSTWIQEGGVSRDHAAQMLGHDDPNTTLIYTHADPTKVLRRAVQIIDAEFHALPQMTEKPGASGLARARKRRSVSRWDKPRKIPGLNGNGKTP